ncbi:MAG: HDOD domain-containing protein, partial [Nitrospirae bacterium]|nr:HDOD domain-containing protein [Nitrospirota bacterium]
MQDKPNAKNLVLKKLQEQSDFPAMSNTINNINQFKTAEDTSVSEFANIVLKDYALTSKVLKLVNSVSYSQFGEVTTVSRAIIIGKRMIKIPLETFLLNHSGSNFTTSGGSMSLMTRSCCFAIALLK